LDWGEEAARIGQLIPPRLDRILVRSLVLVSEGYLMLSGLVGGNKGGSGGRE
jgi:hypothetical protein